MGAGEDAHCDHVHILLDRGFHDLSGRLGEGRCRCTSMPASIKALATTLMPLSCPSSPGLAARTLIFLPCFITLPFGSGMGVFFQKRGALGKAHAERGCQGGRQALSVDSTQSFLLGPPGGPPPALRYCSRQASSTEFFAFEKRPPCRNPAPCFKELKCYENPNLCTIVQRCSLVYTRRRPFSAHRRPLQGSRRP